MNTIFDKNHVTFDDVAVSDRGKHKFISFVEQAADPSTALAELAIYTKDLAGSPALYLRKESDGDVVLLHIPSSSGGSAGFGKLVGSGFGGTPFNLATCTNAATGNYAVTFTNPLVDGNYAVVAIAQTNAGFKFIASILAQTGAGFTVQVFDDGGNFVAPTSVNVIVFGVIA